MHPFGKNGTQNALSFVGPTLWNKIPYEIKRATNLCTFKHDLKKYYLILLLKIFIGFKFYLLKLEFHSFRTVCHCSKC